jgi:hypothetical protein
MQSPHGYRSHSKTSGQRILHESLIHKEIPRELTFCISHNIHFHVSRDKELTISQVLTAKVLCQLKIVLYSCHLSPSIFLLNKPASESWDNTEKI